MSKLSQPADTAIDPMSMLIASEAEKSSFKAYDAEAIGMNMKKSKSNEMDMQDAAQLAKLAVML